MIRKNSNFIPVFQPYISRNDYVKLLITLKEKNISGTSPTVTEFEQHIAKFVDRKFAVSVSNGTVALELALLALDFEIGDEIILPSFTIVSVLSAVIRSGAKPVFCDVDAESWNMTSKNIEKLITQKTKAVIMVHTYGLPADALEIEKLCKINNLYLIEDAAEAHGQTIHNRKCGSFGILSIFSFYANKHITTGEGGCILTNDKYLNEKIGNMKNLDFSKYSRFQHNNMYWNYRLGALQAYLGISQIKNINKIIEYKIKQGKYYNFLLKDYTDMFQLPLAEYSLSNNNYWVYGLVSKKKIPNNFFISELLNANIETRPFFYPLHLQPFLNDKYRNEDLPVSEYLGNFGFYLPTGSHINKKKQKYIVNKLLSLI